MTKIFQRVDSLDYEKDQTETTAQHTVRIWWQVDGGPVRSGELDLTDLHLNEYAVPIEGLLAASEPLPVDGPPKLVRSAAKKPSRAVQRHPDGRVNVAAGKAYRKKQKEWVDENGIKSLDGTDRPAYLTPGGSFGWPKWLDRAYEHYLDTGEIIVPASLEEVRTWEYQQRRATVRGNFAARKGQVTGDPVG